MDDKEKGNLKKNLEFRDVDDEIYILDACGHLKGRFTYFEGSYSYILRPERGVTLTLQDVLEIVEKMKEICKKNLRRGT